MNQPKDHLDTLHEIRDLMEKSSRFISLSGLSGYLQVFLRCLVQLQPLLSYSPILFSILIIERLWIIQVLWLLVLDAVITLFLSFVVAMIFTVRQARKKGQAIWSKTAQRLTINMMIPLVTGGVFCLAFLYQGYIGIIAPSMLVFYGLALINGSKYTLHDIRYLGICEIILGLIATFFIGHGLLFWAIGFGILHIVYGIVMYRKYEK